MRGAGRGKGIQYFPRGTIRDTVFPKNILHGGAKYPRISCMGVPKRGDVIITVTPAVNTKMHGTSSPYPGTLERRRLSIKQSCMILHLGALNVRCTAHGRFFARVRYAVSWGVYCYD